MVGYAYRIAGLLSLSITGGPSDKNLDGKVPFQIGKFNVLHP